jgi:hypothetical protein
MSRDFPGGAGNHLTMGDVPSVDITGTAITFCCWARQDTRPTTRLVMAKANSAGAGQYSMFVGGAGQLSAQLIGAGVLGPNGATVITLGVWHHLAVLQDAAAGSVWLDGIVDGQASGAQTLADTAQPFIVGTRAGDDLPWDGLLADVAMWDTTLHNGEMAALARGVSPLAVRPTRLRGYWPLWALGSPEPDLAGKGAPGTLVGAVPAGASAPMGPHVLA